ncbi:MAG: hypothetical protein CVU57_29245 [Deltaproteobacteria bacterium HGW-Deltaproteobacteria-15]|jgi:hypothetical protein|nr:MAG: hypothetical protein CVU57_29245 [Deltaproteobacteria bacterium HGW-Deltaproteobacteria-15]
MKEALFDWLRLLCKKSLGLSILSGITVILYAGFVYSLEFMWMVYAETHVGKQFIVLHEVDISAVEGLLAEGFLVLSYKVVLAVLTACLALGAASRVFLLARYLYEGRGMIYRVAVWGIPCAVLTAFVLLRTYHLELPSAFLLGLVPTLVLFHTCFRFTQELLPEISTPIGSVVTLAGKILKKERRVERRYDVVIPLSYCSRRSTAECSGIASKISNGGFCIQDSRQLARGDIIKFKLAFENDSVHGEAKIEWTQNLTDVQPKKTPLSASGCRIISMSRNYRNILKGFLSGQSMQEV